jgi:DNA-binding transcriptional ArsR family regulator
MNEHHKQNADILKALGHPIRYCIVEGLCREGERNVATMVDCTNVPQPTVSQHLNILKAAGVIEGKRVGNSILYSACCDEVKKIIVALC